MLTDMPARWTDSSATTVAWNIVGYLLYLALLCIGFLAVRFSFLFPMVTDGCGGPACVASHRVWPAMITVWVGVAAILLVILVVMVRNSSRGNVVMVWPFVGLLAMGFVYVVAAVLLN
jgi:hypothetical protein